jgi:DNA-directed RNA polymerase
MRSVFSKSVVNGLDQVEMPVVYEALNTIQDTPYKINEDVLNVMQYLYDNDTKGVAGLPLAQNIKAPVAPADIETNIEARKAWRKEASNVHEQNHEMVCERLSFLNTVSVAKLMLEQRDDVTGQPLPFFFPHNLDFRGRTYPIPVYLQPQGHDVARGLLVFGTSKPLGSQEAVDWLCIHGANNLGKTAEGYALDKASFEERIQWVLDHSDQICAAAKFPAEFRSFWAGDNVDNPWQFLAFCFEWKKFIDSGRSLSFECSLPGSMDGSCNGLQHYAALLKDEELAKSVNLIPSQVPQDIYRVVASEVNRRLRADVTSAAGAAGATSDLAKAWLTWGKVDRKFVKRQVMTLPYGSGRYGFQNQIKEFLKGLNDKSRPTFWKGETYGAAVSYMAGLIFDSLATSSRSAVEAMEFFKVCARLASKSDAPILWTAPNGLPVQQAYPAMTMKRIDTMLAGGVRCQQQFQVAVTEDDGVKMLNSKKQVSGIAPNIIHSLDASALMLTVVKAKAEGIVLFLMVHDSFGCHMADAPRLSMIVRETFAEMYAGSVVLDGLVADLTNNINVSTLAKGKEIPAAPAHGSLQINEVLDSKYFFA